MRTMISMVLSSRTRRIKRLSVVNSIRCLDIERSHAIFCRRHHWPVHWLMHVLGVMLVMCMSRALCVLPQSLHIVDIRHIGLDVRTTRYDVIWVEFSAAQGCVKVLVHA